MKFFYGKYTNIICEDYDDEFAVEFNVDMYGSPSAGWFFKGILVNGVSAVQYAEEAYTSIKFTSLRTSYWEGEASAAGSSDVSDSFSEGSSISSIGLGLMKKR